MAAEKPQQKRHTIPLHVGDWLSSTTILTMSPAEEGAYFRLLCHAWSSADLGIPSDDASLAALSRLGSAWKKSAARIRDCFVERAGRLYNLRLEAAAEIVEKTSERQRNAANSRWGKTSESESEQHPPIPTPSASLNRMKAEETRINLGEGSSDRVNEVCAIPGARWSTKATLRTTIYAALDSVEWETLLKSYRDHITCAGKYSFTFERFVNERGYCEDWIERKRLNDIANDPDGAKRRKSAEVVAKQGEDRLRALEEAKKGKASPEEASQILAGVLKTFGRGGRSESDRLEKTNGAARENRAGTG